MSVLSDVRQAIGLALVAALGGTKNVILKQTT